MVLYFFSSFLITSNIFALEGAGILIEPLVSYERGRGGIDYPSPFSTSDARVEGVGFGARAGIHVMEILYVGLDGRYSWPEFQDSSLNQKVAATAWNYGPMAGVQIPFIIGLRAWASYILDAELNPEKDRRVDEIFTDGSGYRLGAGLRFLMVSFNLEYQHIKYENTGIEEVGIFSLGYNRSDMKLENNSVIASVSFPLMF